MPYLRTFVACETPSLIGVPAVLALGIYGVVAVGLLPFYIGRVLYNRYHFKIKKNTHCNSNAWSVDG